MLEDHLPQAPSGGHCRLRTRRVSSKASISGAEPGEKPQVPVPPRAHRSDPPVRRQERLRRWPRSSLPGDSDAQLAPQPPLGGAHRAPRAHGGSDGRRWIGARASDAVWHPAQARLSVSLVLGGTRDGRALPQFYRRSREKGRPPRGGRAWGVSVFVRVLGALGCVGAGPHV